MTLYLVGFSDRLERHAEETRRELLKWGATRLWGDVWVVDMDPDPATRLPGFVETEAAFAMPLQDSGAFFSIGRAAGIEAQLVYSEKITPLLSQAGAADAPLADIRYCNGGEAVFARAVGHYLTTRKTSVWATDLCRLMAGHGSDKAIGWHTYAPFYQALFHERRDSVTQVFELGLGTNNEDTPSNMGAHGSPGASLRGWRDYFPHAQVYGADIDRRVLFNEDRIDTFFVDQCDPDTFDALWANIPDIQLDFFLDDGLHTLDAARVTLQHAIGKVKIGGHYIIEDVPREQAGTYLGLIDALGLPGLSIDIDHPTNIYDNCLIVAEIR
jgi:hypothetical protein